MSDSLSSYADLWHPKGVKVRVPFSPDAAICFAEVTAALGCGWLVVSPGLEEGEEKETVGYVLQGSSERDGETTPFVLLYAENDALTWSFLKVYLNKKTDEEAFEYASKMRLDKIDPYVGNDKPQRGASAKTDRFIVKAPRPFGVVFKKNPKHNPDTEEGKMKPARLFVRWADQKPAIEPQQAPAPQPAPPPAQTAKRKRPTNGEELFADLDARDQWLVDNGFAQREALLIHVRDTFKGQFGAVIDRWPAVVIKDALAEATQYMDDCQAAQSQDEEA